MHVYGGRNETTIRSPSRFACASLFFLFSHDLPVLKQLRGQQEPLLDTIAHISLGFAVCPIIANIHADPVLLIGVKYLAIRPSFRSLLCSVTCYNGRL